MWPYSLLPIPPLPPLPPERTWYPHICKLDPYNPTIDKYWYLPHNGVSIDSAPSPVQGLAARLVMWLSAVLPVSRDTKSTLDRIVAWLVPSTVPRAPTTSELDACMYVFKPAGPIYTHPTFLWIIQVALTIIAMYYLLDILDKLWNVVVAFIAQSDDSEDKYATAQTRHIAPAVATATDHDAWPPTSASPAEDSAPSLEQDSPPSLVQDSAPAPAQDLSPSPSSSPTPHPAPAPNTAITVSLQSQPRKRRRSPSPDIQPARHRSWFRSPPRSPSPSPSRSQSPALALLPVSLYSSPAPSSPSPSPPPAYSPAPQQTQASIAELLAAWDASSHAQTRPRMVTLTSTRSLSPPASLDRRPSLSAKSLPRRSRSVDAAREVKSWSKPVTDDAWLRKALDLATEERLVKAHEYEAIVAQPSLVNVGGNTRAGDGVEAPDAPPFPTVALQANDGRDAHPSIQIVQVDATTVPLPDSADDDLEDVTTPSSASSTLEPVTPPSSAPIVVSIVPSSPEPKSSPVLVDCLPPSDGKPSSSTTIEQERAEAVQPTTVLVAILPEPVVENNPIDDVSALSALEPATPAIVSSSATNSLPLLPPTASVTTIEQQSAEPVQSTAVLVAVVDPPAPVVENNPLVDPDTFWTLDDEDAASSSSRSGATPAPVENNPYIDPSTAWDDIAPKPQARSMHQVLPVVRRSQHQTLPGDPVPAPQPQQKQQSRSNKKNSAQQPRKDPPTGRGRGRGPQHVTPDRSAPPPVHPSLTPGAGPSTLSSPPPPPPRVPGFTQGQREMNQNPAHPNLPMHDGPVNQADHAGPYAKSEFDRARSKRKSQRAQPHHVLAFDKPEAYTVPPTTSDPSDSQNQAAKSGHRRRKR